MERFIFYKRVSTDKQAESQLGLLSQQTIAENYVRSVNGRIIETLEEVESRRRVENRPQLLKAIELCRSKNCCLLVSSLSRLAGNVAFTSALLESDVDFICADTPKADKMTLQILASVYEAEIRWISTRTKNALAEKKKKDPLHPLGSARVHTISQKTGLEIKPAHKLSRDEIRKGNEASRPAKRRISQDYHSRILPVIRQYREAGKTFREIASLMNQDEFQTCNGNHFRHTTIHALCKKYGIKKPRRSWAA